MADNIAYRLATVVPWDLDESPDWGRRYDRAEDVMRAWRQRARRHMGDGYRERLVPGDDTYQPAKSLTEMFREGTRRLHRASFGDQLAIVARRTKVKWLIRKVHVRPELIDTVGDPDIDHIHSFLFQGDFKDLESWGIANARYIAGTTTPSMHWPRNKGAGCTARAEDIGAGSSERLWTAARAIARTNRSGKILYAGHEWLPEWNEFRFVGSYIGHYDHVHYESRDEVGHLC